MRVTLMVLLGLVGASMAPPKPVADMDFKQLLGEAMAVTGELAKVPAAVNGVNKLNHILNAMGKKLPAHGHVGYASGLEGGVDSAVHVAFHPVETLEHELVGGWWDLHHLTAPDSGWIIFRTIFVFACIYVAVGMWVMQKYYNARGVESVPHLSFWVSYPGLVADGVAFVADRLGLGTPGNLEKTNGAVDRDTFSQFVPL